MRRRHLCCLLFLLVLVASCGSKNESGNVPELSQGQIIIGGLDWVEIGDLSESNQIKEWSQAVADIDLPVMGARCTGFLISEDVLMTNEHCIPAASYARGVSVTFDHIKGTTESQRERFDCSEFIGNDSTLDYALLRCSGSPGSVYGYVSLDSQSFSRGKAITVIQQNCDYYNDRSCDWSKKYSKGKITQSSDEYTHNADTLGGSSGSPVFDSSTGRVIAIHHAGLGNDGQGRGVENYAVPMAKIVPHIVSRFPSLFDQVGGDGDSDRDQATDKDPKGAGDSAASAYDLKSKTQSFSERIGVSGDFDFYKLVLKSGESAKVSVKFSHSKGDLDIKVLGTGNTVVAKSEGTTGIEQVELSSAGTYYVVVYGYKDATGDYEFSLIKSAASSQATEFVDSSNDSAGQAKFYARPSSGANLAIESSSDADYFGFELAAGESFVVQMKLKHSDGDLDLYVLDEDQKVVAKSETTTNVESVNFKATKSGKYFVLVKGYRGATGSYELSAQ